MEATSKPATTPETSIPIEKISIDPNQPRKTYDENGLKELADSILTDGIIQSITLREKGSGYLIICGERRYRAAMIAGLKEVPAKIKNVSDEEAFRMQLVENLQREDIHPMQQARGFKMLVEQRNMDVQQISNRVGKSIYFVRQQLKLNDLSPKWQSIFQKDGISVTTAIQICTLPPDAQNELYESKVSKEDEKSSRPYISINNYLFNQYRGDLSTACFDIKDPELDKKMGACISCPFNSALASSCLFPDEQRNPRCNNISCFKNKTTIHLDKELQKAMEDPSVILVYSDYSTPDIAKKLKDEGAELLKVGYGEECKPVRKPEKLEWEKFYREKKKQNLPERKIKEEFRKEEDNYKFENEVFEKKVATGRYKKAFMVHSNTDRETGKYFYVEMTPKITIKSNKKKIEDGNGSIEDIDNEISRIKQREVRAKELDREKVQRRIVEAVKADKTAKKIPPKSASTDMMLLYFLASEHLGYSNKQEVQKVIKIPGIWSAKDIEQFKKAFQSLTKTQLTYLVRMIIIDKYSTQLPDTAGGYAFRIMAEGLGTISIPDFEKEQAEKARKRQQNVNQSIGIYQEMKQELLKAQKSTAKNKTTKEATPKKVRA
jgi:ParB-like partition proteins